tara:strand:+ start:230 stop:925 length:696 start_codon:yes stop_codon:yes gene_type:complete
MNLITLIRFFIKTKGRRPTPNELSELKKQAMAPKSADIIKFPEGGKDRVPVEKQFGGIKSLDEFKKSEDIYEIERKLLGKNPNLKDLLKSEESMGLVERARRLKEAADELVEKTKIPDKFDTIEDFEKFFRLPGQFSPAEVAVRKAERIKAGLSTKIKLNSAGENKQLAKDLINRKGEYSDEFNSLKADDRKEVLDQIEAQIKKDTDPIGPPTDPDEIPFAKGGLANMLRL